MRKSKLKTLSKLLPLVISMTGGFSSPASALELSAVDLAARIADAFAHRSLPDAQVAINQLLACNIRALRFNGVVYPILELQTTLDQLARGQDVPVPPRPTGAAVFIVEPGGWADEGAICRFGQETQPVTTTAVFPVGSQGTPST
jgi:hypothetical protein